jgi:hypothetical protein
MTMRRIIVPLIAAVVFTGCDLGTTTSAEEFEWFGLLQPVEGWEHLSGQAGFAWASGFSIFVAAAEIFGDEPGAVRPWHLHHNTCAEGGGIVGLDADYPRLVVDATGSAGAAATIPLGVYRRRRWKRSSCVATWS